MTRPHWQLKRWLRRRSREGFIGLALLVICLSFDLALLGPTHNRLEQLRKNLASVDTHASARLPEQTLAKQQLTHYYSYFPPQSSAPDWLNKIYRAAGAQQIQIIQGEYRVQRSETGKLIRYHITIPVIGTYAQLRHFIATVLTDIPIASLDNVSFERQKIEDPTITAKVTFTLYLAVTT